MSSSKKQKRSKSPIGSGSSNALRPTGLLLTCADVPTKQYIMYLNDKKPVDKKFVLQDLDATHILIKNNTRSRNEIVEKLEKFMDSNVFSAVEKVGEDLDMS
eukprot:CAMPEP_0194062590 /NCGR_PEP_ID=MMETSP0009_2-20130614/77944_1 /TAXON_ID=210454 /ORGANISM="Grammatophora oceanica, Strain CCMP 410" /LENGTH=101 /DNA_ID=CAMNT_0038714379 /DNA_START=48 /DNA_END=356 /DNA_ORIENTATION=-